MSKGRVSRASRAVKTAEESDESVSERTEQQAQEHRCAALHALVRECRLSWTQNNTAQIIIATADQESFEQLNPQLPPNVIVHRSKLKYRRRRGRRWGEIDEKPTALTTVGHTTARWRLDSLLVKTEPTLALITGGRSRFSFGESQIECPGGTWIFIPPGVPQPDGSRPHLPAEADDGDWCDILWVAPWQNVLRCWVCHSRGSSHPTCRADESCFLADAQVKTYFDALTHEAIWRGRDYREACALLLPGLFLAIDRLLENEEFFVENYLTANQDDFDYVQDPIARSLKYVRNHLHLPLTLASVAHVVRLSRARFAREFHQQTGQTFHHYLTDCRMEHVREVLAETRWSMAFIACSVGLSQSRLNATFRAMHGCSPGEYRTRMQAAKRRVNAVGPSSNS